MSSDLEQQQNVASITTDLSRWESNTTSDDLVGLAKMHGLVEALVEATGTKGAEPNTAKSEQATSLGRTLETVILGEAEDLDAAMASIKQTVSSLAGDSSVALSHEPQASVDTEELSDEEVSQRLSLIFDEDDAPTGAAPTESSGAELETKGTETPSEPQPQPASQAEAPTQQDTRKEVAAYEPEPLTISKKEEEFVMAFVEEASEHIEAIEASLLEVERSPNDAEQIDNLFRPFHTIKGMAGFLNLRDVNCLTHEVETLLDEGRKGKRSITPALIDLVFDVVDILKLQTSAINEWIQNPEGDTIAQPPVADMIVHLRNVVAGNVVLTAREPSTGSPTQRVGENLVEQGACTQEAVDFAVAQQEASGGTAKIGEILIKTGAVTPKAVSQAIRPQTQAKQPSIAVGEASVRIDTVKLDQLVDMVGELVIAQTLVSANPKIATDPRLSKDSSQVTKIVRDVQEAAMGMRMIPVGGTFQKMARLVRDVSRKAGKEVELLITGEETELDKNVIQQISDPLVHMIRNSVDHGIEIPDVRTSCGKPSKGTVRLSAFHHGGNIVIEISDDGKGLDPKALIAKGIEKGLIGPEDELTDQQAFALVFAAGFSTAAKVTDISGRGVGMDVVRRNIEQLRGRIDIASELGKGSTFSIRLPLTLAIIDGLVIRVGSERFILQTITVEQSLRPTPEQITTVQHRGELLNVRGRLIPLIQLGSLFGLSGRVDPCEAMVVIAHGDGGQIGLVVEELIGQQQVVIKSLGDRFEALRGISGAAILGDGRVGLILEMSGLAAAHSLRRTSSLETSEKRDTGAAKDSGAADTKEEPASATVESEDEVFIPA